MARMFYTLEEAAQVLGIEEEQVRDLAASGKVQQFRDRDKLMFKRDQIDSMARSSASGSGTSMPATESINEDTDQIELAEEPSLDDGGKSKGRAEDPRHATGISVFDASEIDAADPMAQTQVSEPSIDDEDLALESVGSGSGLLDLTKESDDTSLGADLLDDFAPADQSAAGGSAVPASSGVFDGILAEQTGAGLEPPEQGTYAAHDDEYGDLQSVGAAEEPYDPGGSFMSFGFLLGAMVAVVLATIVGISLIMDAPLELTRTLAGDPGSNTALLVGGGLLLASIIMGVVGLLVGKAQG
ncbi:MAG: helix-turn-helix domain-containing protein [Phycisphaeraceae bacterium]|nr:helix-turn-helix domain-containing protein [Phycisphaeraceae bacterium]